MTLRRVPFESTDRRHRTTILIHNDNLIRCLNPLMRLSYSPPLVYA